jgi:uncharacterized protein YbjT (DUF2867 family)
MSKRRRSTSCAYTYITKASSATVYHLKVEASRRISSALRVKSVTAMRGAYAARRQLISLPSMAIDVAVVGGHGKIALRLLRLLSERGDRARGLIRNPDHAADVEATGATAVGADIENLDAPAVARAIAGVDAVVFAAGAGPGSGPARKRTVDYGGAVKLIEAAQMNDISRYLIVSAIGANHPENWPDEMRPYFEAKVDADREVAESGLDYTIVRPGGLTEDSGTGLIDAAPDLGRYGQIPRDDVAATLLACLDEPASTGKAFDAVSGEVPIAEAVAAL